MCLLNKSLAHPKQYRVTVLYRVCVPASPGVFLPGPGTRYRYSTGTRFQVKSIQYRVPGKHSQPPNDNNSQDRKQDGVQ